MFALAIVTTSSSSIVVCITSDSVLPKGLEVPCRG